MNDDLTHLEAELELQKALVAEAQAMTAKVCAENEALRADAERYRWLFSAHTTESLDKAQRWGEQPESKPQDAAIGYLAGWYCDKATADKIVDAAMKGQP
jgi:multidrug resistance efflux pump